VSKPDTAGPSPPLRACRNQAWARVSPSAALYKFKPDTWTFNPNSEFGPRVAATPRRSKVLATPSSPRGQGDLSNDQKNATGASRSPSGDEASPPLAIGTSEFEFKGPIVAARCDWGQPRSEKSLQRQACGSNPSMHCADTTCPSRVECRRSKVEGDCFVIPHNRPPFSRCKAGNGLPSCDVARSG